MYNLWVGAFYDQSKRKLYLFPIPMLGLVMTFDRIRRSQMKRFKVGDSVKCLYGNSRHKFWALHLEQNNKIKAIRWNNSGYSELRLGDDWFYENDFKKSNHPTH